uniref:Uncharacterized protein n=1 Tax=Anopheles christyi TaxID=43041 RepID=A0A182JTJ1_9DIPT
MAGEMLLASCLLALCLLVPGLDTSYPSASGQENDFPHALKNVHSVEVSGHYQESQEFHQQHQAPEYQHSAPAPHQHHQQHLFQPHQQYVVQSTYNVDSHQQGKQRQTALPYNNQRLHVKIEHPGAAHGFAHPITPSAQHLRQQMLQEPKKDYRSLIPKSIAPKLNPLHSSFHQKRNFVPLHHITRQVPVPAGKPNQGHQHSSHGQSEPVKAALAGPPPKHIAG